MSLLSTKPTAVVLVAALVLVAIACLLEVVDFVAARTIVGQDQTNSGVVVPRMVAKNRIAREVADGRRSLWDAAALYGVLNRSEPALFQPALLTYVPSSIPTDTPEGRLCFQVVAHVLIILHDDPQAEAEAQARLEAEFFEELRRRGRVELPNPSVSAEELLREARLSLAAAR